MDLEIDQFVIQPTKVAIATMLVMYKGLIFRCALVWNSKGSKYWFRMPEYWADKNCKVSYCWWPTKEKSDQFQKEMLQKIFDSGMLNESEIAKIHAYGAKKSQQKQNA